jgi:hypothetical protein
LIYNNPVEITDSGAVKCKDIAIKQLVQTILDGNYFKPENGVLTVFNMFFDDVKLIDQSDQVY